MKTFNTTAVCIPSKHYMVDLSQRVEEIKRLVDDGKYFTINCARQYGKTTTLNALEQYLSKAYDVLSIDFQDMTASDFADESEFVKGLAQIFCDLRGITDFFVPEEFYHAFWELANEKGQVKLSALFRIFEQWCRCNAKPMVLMIDEVDSAANNQVFLDFLSKLRANYLKREKHVQYKTFQSVILAGVTDVRNLKGKIRDDIEVRQNSPWNIAADFTIDMSLSASGIKGMLDEYEKDHHTGMDTAVIAGQIREYTGGYPFLVSRLCQIIAERLVPEVFSSDTEAWTVCGVDEAVKRICSEKNTLFDSIMSKLNNYSTLKDQLRRILLIGETVEYLPDNVAQDQLRMYGFLVNDHNTVAVANKIFEMRLYKYYIGESRFAEELRGEALDHKPEFIKGGSLDIPLIMEHFIRSQKYIRDIADEAAAKRFVEEEGRERFLTYLSPIINGVGTYEIEPQTRSRRRMDLVIHYAGKRYIVELKICRGASYHTKGEQQLLDYLDAWDLDTGYMLTFNFNKKKKPGVEVRSMAGKTIYEGTV